MTDPGFFITPFQGVSLPNLEPLLYESVQTGLNSLRRLEADWASGKNRFDQPGEAFFLASSLETIVGVCGLNLDPYSRASEAVGRVRRLYVLQSKRCQGVGRALVESVIDQAKLARMQEVRVRVGNPDSAGFFLRLGFTPAEQAESYTHSLRLKN